MTPHPGHWGAPPKPQTSLVAKLRWPALAVTVMGAIGWFALARNARHSPQPQPLEGYQHDASVLEREYGVFHGRLLREPELESQFALAGDLVRQKQLPAAIGALEKIAKDAPVPAVFTNLGSLYAATGDQARAMLAFREALARDAEYKPARDIIDRLRLFSFDDAHPVRQEIEPNNSEVVANLIALGGPVDGEIRAGDTDTFKFVTPPAPRDILQIEAKNEDASLEMEIRVHDGELRNEDGRVQGAAGESLKRYLSQPPNRSLYLQIWGSRNTTGKYRITITPLKSFDAMEPNDDIFTARRIELGKTVEANIMDSEDTDFYTFQSLVSGAVTIDLKNDSATLIPAITTFNSEKRNTGFGPDVRSPGAGLKHTMEVQQYRTYFVQVWSQARSSGRYSLTIR